MNANSRVATTIGLTFVQFLVAAPIASAGCLDWLFGGKRTAYYIPTATYVPGPTGPTVTAGYLPSNVAYSPVGYPSVPNSQYPQVAGQQVVSYAAPNMTQPALPVVSPYGNPSVAAYRLPPVTAYSPVVGNVQSGYPIQAAPYAAVPAPRRSFFGSWSDNFSSYFGAGNYYPSNTPYPSDPNRGSFWSQYRMPGMEDPTMYPPQIQNPVVTPIPMGTAAPNAYAAPHSMGFAPQTVYSTNTYSAPVTYYRPVTTVDPNTGLQQTSMQACQSSETRVQRIPSYAFGSSQPQTSSVPCPPEYGVNCDPAQAYSGYSTPGPTSRPTFVPSAPQNQLEPAGQSYPSISAPNPASPTYGGDQSPVGQPQLNANPTQSYFNPNASTTATSGASRTQPSQSNVKPIPAPPQYRFQYNTNEPRTASVEKRKKRRSP